MILVNPLIFFLSCTKSIICLYFPIIYFISQSKHLIYFDLNLQRNIFFSFSFNSSSNPFSVFLLQRFFFGRESRSFPLFTPDGINGGRLFGRREKGQRILLWSKILQKNKEQQKLLSANWYRRFSKGFSDIYFRNIVSFALDEIKAN